MEELRQAGATDYFGLPLLFADETPVQLTFATDREGGFSDNDLRAFADVALVLARVAEAFAVRMRVERVLNTYVGRDAGKRVTAGQIQRGKGETIEAAVLFADLRDFTALSESLPRDAVLELLNEYFDRVGTAVEAEGGEILKFIGDGVLAIFPVADKRPISGAALAAIRASDAVSQSFESWNRGRLDRGQPPVGFGIALHGGEVMYGNVGTSTRLDFTAIGPVVNTVSRMQALCRTLATPILLSEEIAGHWPDLSCPLGEHNLRGLAQGRKIFTLIAEAVRSSAKPAK